MASSRLKDAVIFHVLGRRVPFMIMNNRIQTLWAVRGQVRITDMGAGFFTARFDSSEDYRRALLEGPWKIGEHYIVPRLWQEGFDPCTDTLSHTLVWVRLPGLPLEFFTETFLRRIGDKIGQLVRIDPTTLAMERGNYARICVRVDLSKKLLSKYKLLHKIRRVEYEGLHVVCFKCGIYGHTIDICPSARATETASQGKEMAHSNPLFFEEVLVKERPEVFEDFGPWMLAKSRSRKSSVVTSIHPGHLPRPTGERQSSAPIASEPPQGSRFTVLADEAPSSKPATAATPVVHSNPTPPSAASKSGAQKKQRAKKGVDMAPDAETSTAKRVGNRAPKSTVPKGTASVSTKGKSNAQVTILKRQRPAIDKTLPDPPSSTAPVAAPAQTEASKDAVRIMGVTSQPRQAPVSALAASDMIVDSSTDGSMPRSVQQPPSVFREVLLGLND
ncbi:hypothetical protein LINPERHAP2_LOCUS18034 [Linum perenne]